MWIHPVMWPSLASGMWRKPQPSKSQRWPASESRLDAMVGHISPLVTYQAQPSLSREDCWLPESSDPWVHRDVAASITWQAKRLQSCEQRTAPSFRLLVVYILRSRDMLWCLEAQFSRSQFRIEGSWTPRSPASFYSVASPSQAPGSQVGPHGGARYVTYVPQSCDAVRSRPRGAPFPRVESLPSGG